MDNINYENAIYSLAKIDLNAYIEFLNSLEETLSETISVMNLILNRNRREDIECQCLKEYALKKLFETKKHIISMCQIVKKYDIKLEEFLKNNTEKRSIYVDMKEKFNVLFEEKCAFIDERIYECLEFIKENNAPIEI